jgi:hypothetical protein
VLNLLSTGTNLPYVAKIHYSMLSYSQGRELDVEEIDETEEDDRTKFKDQLQTIGSFGRQVCQSA